MTGVTSLRRRLVLLVLAATALLWIGAGVWSYRAAHRQIDAVFDAQLAQTARAVLARVEHEYDEDEGDEDERPRRHERRGRGDSDRVREDDFGGRDEESRRAGAWRQEVWFEVRAPSGDLLQRSSAQSPPLAGFVRDGFHDATVGGERLRVFVTDDDGLRVAAAQRHAPRERLAARFAAGILAPLLLAVPLLAVGVYLAVRRGLKPLDGFAREVGRRGPHDLAPLEGEVPREVRPLQTALNELLAGLERSLAAERRFTADAAHELRTPLAGLRAQAQVALTAADERERGHALEHLLAAVDRHAHLVDQMLTLARLEPDDALGDTERVSLVDPVRAAMAALTPAAVKSGVEVDLEANEEVVVDGNAALLEVLVRNLVDNAIRHGRDGGEVGVRLRVEEGRAVLAVTDRGPGIPEAERERVFERFARRPGSAGSGLGLAIVRRIAGLHRATLKVSAGPDGTGLSIRVLFPPAGFSSTHSA